MKETDTSRPINESDIIINEEPSKEVLAPQPHNIYGKYLYENESSYVLINITALDSSHIMIDIRNDLNDYVASVASFIGNNQWVTDQNYTFVLVGDNIIWYATDVLYFKRLDTSSPAWIFEDSDSRYLTDDEIYGLSKEKARMAVNEIAARHGRIFKDAEIRDYFLAKYWYDPTLSKEEYDKIVDSILNNYEQVNSERLVARKNGEVLPTIDSLINSKAISQDEVANKYSEEQIIGKYIGVDSVYDCLDIYFDNDETLCAATYLTSGGYEHSILTQQIIIIDECRYQMSDSGGILTIHGQGSVDIDGRYYQKCESN